MVVATSSNELPVYHQHDAVMDHRKDENNIKTTQTFSFHEASTRVLYGMLFFIALLFAMHMSTIYKQEDAPPTVTTQTRTMEWIHEERNLSQDVEQGSDSMLFTQEEGHEFEESMLIDGHDRELHKVQDIPNVKVAAYYYPWHGPDFHYGGGYMRESLNQFPELGEYDDSDPETVKQHLEWSRQANINLWITSWWGPDSREDETTRNVILPHDELKDHEICLLYETSNRLQGHDGDWSTHRVIDDMKHMAKHYWDHPNYSLIQGRPVVFLYISRVLTVDNYLDEVLLLMRTAAAKLGHNIYIVGDQAFGPPPDDEYGPFIYFDAVTTYDVYGMLARGYAYRDGVMKYYEQQDLWRQQAQKQECAFMPAVSPGFNDRGVRIEVDHLPLSRRLSPRSPFGSLFQLSLKQAMKQLDPKADNILCVNSFNEWHEDSQIEPVKGTPISTNPFELTKGLEYQAYGTLYLDILGRVTRGQPDLVSEVPDRPELPEDAFLYQPPDTRGGLDDLEPEVPNVKVAAYYYPWHGPDFHYGGGYMRKSLNQFPELGEYDDSKPETVAQHLEWSRQANINLWITSWWGPDSREDVTTRTVILPHDELKDHEICLLYETSNRLKGHDGDRSTHRVINDMKYMAKHYWDHPNYLRIQGRPVVFLYISRVLTVENYLDEVMLLMRSAAAKLGHNIYVVGDQAFGTPPSGEYGPFDYFDAVTTYDVYGMLARGYAYRDGVMNYYEQQELWKAQAQKQECAFMPAVSPGFNDRGVRIGADHLPLSRRLSPRSPFGSLFQLSLKHAMTQLDPKADNILCINSFNEWHEDSQVEPVKGTPISTSPFELTKGLEYQAYGTLYLDILGRVTRGQGDLVSEVPDRPESPEDAFLYESTAGVEAALEELEPMYNDEEGMQNTYVARSNDVFWNDEEEMGGVFIAEEGGGSGEEEQPKESQQEHDDESEGDV